MRTSFYPGSGVKPFLAVLRPPLIGSRVTQRTVQRRRKRESYSRRRASGLGSAPWGRSKSASSPVQQQPSVVAPDRSALLQEIIGNVRAASENASALVRRAVERIARSQAELQASPARDALKLAIWSQKEQIPHDEVERLRPLWGVTSRLKADCIGASDARERFGRRSQRPSGIVPAMAVRLLRFAG